MYQYLVRPKKLIQSRILKRPNGSVTGIGAGYPCGLSYCPQNGLIYECNYYQHYISVINPQSNSVTSTIASSASPINSHYCPSTNRIYVGSWNNNTITVINPTTNAVTTTFSLHSAGTCYGIKYVPSTGMIYFSNTGGNKVECWDPNNNTFVNNLSTITQPFGLYWNPTNNYLYIGAHAAIEIRLMTNGNLVTTITGMGTIDSIYGDLDSKNNRLYIADVSSATVCVINCSSNAVITTLSIGVSYGITYIPTINRVISRYTNTSFAVVNCDSYITSATYQTGMNSSGYMLYVPSTDMLYIGNDGNGSVTFHNPQLMI